MKTPCDQPAPTGKYPRKRLTDWQCKSLRKFVLGGLAAGIVGMIAGGLVQLWLGERNSSFLTLPWLIVFSLIVPAAYQQGVRDGRAHPEDTEDATTPP